VSGPWLSHAARHCAPFPIRLQFPYFGAELVYAWPTTAACGENLRSFLDSNMIGIFGFLGKLDYKELTTAIIY
jgi:hypothetical protein